MPYAEQELPVIRPITDLRTRLNEVCQQATQEQAPIVLTKNGTAAYVLMDSDAYDRQKKSNRVYLALREAEIEKKYRPDAMTEEESNAKMADLFAMWGLAYA